MEILVPGQWCNELRIIYVNAHALGLEDRKHTITHNIGCGGVSSRCAHIHRVLNEIPPNC